MPASPSQTLEGLQGRVTSQWMWVYHQPSFRARRVKLYWRDRLLPITAVTISDDVQDYNRVWYQVGDEGFAYSGVLQPVRVLLNDPILDIPATGVLGEVSVPFTDAHEQPEARSSLAYRMYYESVHWILSAVAAPDGRIWYQVLDDKWDRRYYAAGEHLRLIPDDELAPLSPQVPEAQKRIQVRLKEQLLLAYENDNPVFAARLSSGGALREGTYTTPAGSFMTYHKRPTRHMAAGDLTASGFDLPGVPWVMYLTEGGISLHGTYWHNDFGYPKSHGCINLAPSAAKWLYRWTNPALRPGERVAYRASGTAVEIVK